jgi:hypothetical protein
MYDTISRSHTNQIKAFAATGRNVPGAGGMLNFDSNTFH